MEGVLQRPAAHGGVVHPHSDADFLLGLVKEGDAAPEPVDDVVEQVLFGPEGHRPAFPRE